jgi:hypothetical protein
MVAFLAGFSDKFYLGVIDLLVARTIKSEEKDRNTKVTKTQRIPESDAERETKDAAEQPKSKS